MKFKKYSGFSLVELMIVVGIIGILASMVVPRYEFFKIKAYQSEAKMNLKSLHALEETYHMNFNTYISMPSYGLGNCSGSPEQKALGFSVTNCSGTRYEYGVLNGAGRTNFIGAATAMNLNARCPTATDSWRVEADGSVYVFQTFAMGYDIIYDVTHQVILHIMCPSVY